MKKVLKSALSLLLACLLLIPGGIVFAYEPVDFTDVDADDWFAPYVDYCSGNGLVNGMTATTFEPNTSLSRAMFVTLLYRFEEAEATEGAEMPFTDVSEKHWAKDAILWAYNAGIVNGMTPTTFEPDGLITREQMCTIICRFADSVGYDIPTAEGYGIFADEEKISDWAYDSVFVCYAAGIVNGITEDSFGPKQNATRAQACTILQRFIRYATTTVTKGEAQDGKVTFTEADKFGIYATGYYLYDENGNEIEYYYEDEYGSWSKTEITYDEKGRETFVKYSDSDGYSSEESSEYDDNDNLIYHEFTDSEKNVEIELFEYNENGDRVFYKYYNGYGYTILETCTYDENGNPLTREYTESDGYFEREDYTYDENGQLTEHMFGTRDGLEIKYTYSEGRLFKVEVFMHGEKEKTISFSYTGEETFIRAQMLSKEGQTVINHEFYEDGSFRGVDIYYCSTPYHTPDNSISVIYDKDGAFEAGAYFDEKLFDDGAYFSVDANCFNGPDGAPDKFLVRFGTDDRYPLEPATVDYEKNEITVSNAVGQDTYAIDSEFGTELLAPVAMIKALADNYQPLTAEIVAEIFLGL